MTAPVTGDRPSFFASPRADVDLVSIQVDPSQPQVDGVSLVSDPATADRWIASRLVHFDPELYDLRDSSHLMRLIKALLGAGGVGGQRKQALIRRLESGSIAGTSYLSLDAFWGELFSLFRSSHESLGFDPHNAVLDEDSWDAADASDASYRSRLTQLAKAFNQGATYHGLIAAAEAVLGVEVELIELWTLTDLSEQNNLGANTWFAVQSQYPTWASTEGLTWAQLIGGEQSPGQVPIGGRGEVIFLPKASITQEQKAQALRVLSELAPSQCLVTVVEQGIEVYRPVAIRGVEADSVDWSVSSSVDPRGDLLNADDVYPARGTHQAGRPALSAYTGQSWDYNSRIAQVSSYTMVDGVPDNPGLPDFQTVTFLDGQSQSYPPKDAVLPVLQSAAARIASEGILATYPYAETA